jgi:hypothetical protein
MPKSTALDPVVTRSGTEQFATSTIAKNYTVAIDPLCRQFTGAQTATPEIAS